ncbi:OmpA family protein [Lacisediminimonas profundi]|uniref:OmpA family protein n=1 Tax=Lacisediminimonas profundi TaxID=2603856 RepID=UPI00124AED55|nr:OmpA family protein [Lacisediminimonas profundi]
MLDKLTAGILMSMTVLAAHAQTGTDVKADSPSSAYAQDSRGMVVRTQHGLCVRNGYWTPADGVIGCDGTLAAPVAKITAPPPAAAAPAPAAPAVVAAAPKPAPKRCDASITLGADETFAFNKAVLTPAARKRIDAELPGKIAACSKVDLLIVTGHSDRIGSHQSNQKLSEKRAAAVATYIQSKGINAPIDMLGAGKTQSIKACDDKLPRKKLIECLAPNRRVVIEIRGPGK